MAWWQWSKTAANNANADGSINWAEGMPPALVNDSGRAMMARTAEFRDDTSGLLVTAGTSTAYTVTTNQGLTATPNDGQLIVVSFHTVNGAAATLAADLGTAFPLQGAPGVALPSGTLVANVPYPLKFRTASSAWILFGAANAAVAASVAAGSVTNTGFANMAAWTIKMNNTSGSAPPTDVTIDGLTLKASPLGADEVPIWDAAGTAMKKATMTALAALFGTLIPAPTVQRFTSGTSLTYTPTAGIARIKVRMCAGGGGGGGSTSGNNGGTGGTTSFGAWTCIGGGGGNAPTGVNAGGAGGTGGTGGVDGTGTKVIRFPGGNGSPGVGNGSSAMSGGGSGGTNPFGGAGSNGNSAGTSTGTAGAANTGAGGGGYGGTAGTGTATAGCGAAGEFIEFWMTAAQVGASQAYTVGGAGTAGTGGGAAGAAGVIIVEEFYV